MTGLILTHTDSYTHLLSSFYLQKNTDEKYGPFRYVFLFSSIWRRTRKHGVTTLVLACMRPPDQLDIFLSECPASGIQWSQITWHWLIIADMSLSPYSQHRMSIIYNVLQNSEKSIKFCFKSWKHYFAHKVRLSLMRLFNPLAVWNEWTAILLTILLT